MLMVVFGCASREITGHSRQLTTEEMSWLEKSIESDFGSINGVAGKSVQEGKMMVRAQGEVISCGPLIQAGKRGALNAGAIILEGSANADLEIKGEVNVHGIQEGRHSENRYVFELKLVESLSHVVQYSQKYIILNKFEQEKWK